MVHLQASCHNQLKVTISFILPFFLLTTKILSMDPRLGVTVLDNN